MSTHSSPFPSCFRLPTTTSDHHRPPQNSDNNPNLTTSLYQTYLGLFSLTWSNTALLGHSLHLHLLPIDTPHGLSPLSLSNPLSLSSTFSFHLHVNPFVFWKKYGSKKLQIPHQESANYSKVQIFWDFSLAKFGSGPEPLSGFYVAVVVDREIVLLVGDLTKEAVGKTKAKKPQRTQQVLVMRREHVIGNRVYVTSARFGGKNREIIIDCNVESDGKLGFIVDKKRVLEIKHLKWKFRGNERVEVEGVPIQVSWDVYKWLFEDTNNNNGHAGVFVFGFEGGQEVDQDENGGESRTSGEDVDVNKKGLVWRKMTRKKKMLVGGINNGRRSLSSSSMSISSSSASSSGCASSVMEWASGEDSELGSPNGFSLLVYAWKK